jgi:hypothetical protein
MNTRALMELMKGEEKTGPQMGEPQRVADAVVAG